MFLSVVLVVVVVWLELRQKEKFELLSCNLRFDSTLKGVPVNFNANEHANIYFSHWRAFQFK